MNISRVVIVDDELLATDVIAHHLGRFPNYEVIKTFTESVEAFKFLNDDNRIDLVFADIAMPEISGIEMVRSLNTAAKFIMTTSFSQYAVESFDLDVVDYLLKPISFERFCKAISRFEKTFTSDKLDLPSTSFFVQEGDEFVKILLADIDYIEGMKDYVKIVTGTSYCLALKSLKSIEAALAPYGFLRVHKSYIVPLEKISQYSGRSIILKNREIPVGGSFKDSLKLYLNKHKL